MSIEIKQNPTVERKIKGYINKNRTCIWLKLEIKDNAYVSITTLGDNTKVVDFVNYEFSRDEPFSTSIWDPIYEDERCSRALAAPRPKLRRQDLFQERKPRHQ